MAENSSIEWTTHTFSPWWGCEKIAAGCAHCYAATFSKRLGKDIWGAEGERRTIGESGWCKPYKWDRWASDAQAWCSANTNKDADRPRVFCASMCDIFEEWDGEVHDWKGNAHYTSDSDCTCFVSSPQLAGMTTDGLHYSRLDDLRKRVFLTIDGTENLDWLLLTKRPENIPQMWCSHVNTDGKPPSQLRRDNVWLGTSIACQDDADRNIPLLLKCRDLAPVLFLSIEPLVGPVDISGHIRRFICEYCQASYAEYVNGCPKCELGEPGLSSSVRELRIDWVIIGGESGQNARPCNVEWIRSIVRQCEIANVPCFVKQLGKHVFDSHADCHVADNIPDFPLGTQVIANRTDPFAAVGYQLKDAKGGDWNEWPEDLRVREFPVIGT